MEKRYLVIPQEGTDEASEQAKLERSLKENNSSPLRQAYNCLGAKYGFAVGFNEKEIRRAFQSTPGLTFGRGSTVKSVIESLVEHGFIK